MFKNSKTGIIIFAVFVVAAIAFFPTIGSNVKEYKDTNGENDFSLCKITDEDIIEGTVTFSQYIFNESDEELSFRLALQLDDGGWTIPDNSQSKMPYRYFSFLHHVHRTR